MYMGLLGRLLATVILKSRRSSLKSADNSGADREPASKPRLVAETRSKRLLILEDASGFYHFIEETEQEGDEYTGPYFSPTHFSGLYASAEAAERDARATLPWLRDQNSN
jgi:hypothetical protein